MSDQNGSVDTGNPAPGAGDTWYSGIGDEGLRTYVQTKGWKDPASLADSYRNLEKLQGVPQDRLLKLPEKADDPAWGEIYGRLGRPAEPKGYELKFDGDSAFADRMAAKMHSLGLSKSAAAGLNEEWNAYVNELITNDTREKEQRDATELQALKTKWGQQFDAHTERGRRAGREFGLSEDDFKSISASLGPGKTLELFQRIGAKLGEPTGFDPAGAGGRSSFGLTPEAARARIETLRGDKEWVSRYLSGGAAEKEEMGRLQQLAVGQQA